MGTGSDTVLFKVANDPGFTYLDDVSLTPSAAAVPEPSGLFLGAVAGVVGIGYAWRRRRAKSVA